MSSSNIDLSLAEVYEWREKLRLECESMSREEEITYIHQKAQEFMRRHNLNIVTMDSRSRKTRTHLEPIISIRGIKRGGYCVAFHQIVLSLVGTL